MGAGSWAGALCGSLTPAPPAGFLYQQMAECDYTNGTERVRYLYRLIYNRQQLAHFDSDRGVFVADSELVRRDVDRWNQDKALLAQLRADVDRPQIQLRSCVAGGD
uniref:MHC class II beta chain N-terminal domain-containing protein n=1 Tax=Pelusios castaneus TaxID=367368 RepID=A0A8C8SJV5_9SAUR